MSACGNDTGDTPVDGVRTYTLNSMFRIGLAFTLAVAMFAGDGAAMTALCADCVDHAVADAGHVCGTTPLAPCGKTARKFMTFTRRAIDPGPARVLAFDRAPRDPDLALDGARTAYAPDRQTNSRSLRLSHQSVVLLI